MPLYLVATVRALKYNGGVAKEDLGAENLDALKKGIANLKKHIENVSKFGVPCVVTLNRFVSDTDAELSFVKEFCEERGCDFALSEVWEHGGEGGIALARKVLNTLENKESHYAPLYQVEQPIKEKIETIAKEIYGAGERQLFTGGISGNHTHWRSLVMGSFQSVWQRISIRCPMIQSCSVVQRIFQSISVRYMYLQGQAL